MSAFSEQLIKLNERAQELSENPSELAKDALLADVIAFYDEVKALKLQAKKVAVKKTPAPKPVVEPVPVVVPTPEPVAEVVPEPVVEVAPEPKKEVVEKAPEVVTEVPAEKEEPKPAKEPVAEKPVEKEEPAKAAKEPMIAENKAEDGDKDEKILAGQFNKEPLKDLRSGIPLNEKFGIIRNLFKGNASDFGDAVLKLNNAANTEEMSHYMELLSQRFTWDMESEAYKSFLGYVERKKMTLQPSAAD
jgi:hypothetical protein